MEFPIPESLKAEHDEFRGKFIQVAREKGRLGSGAAALLRALKPHSSREEEFVFPPLSLLFPLAGGRLSAEMRDVLPLTEKMKQELPSLLPVYCQPQIERICPGLLTAIHLPDIPDAPKQMQCRS